MSLKLSSIPYPPNVDYSKQAIVLPGSKKPGQTGTLAAVFSCNPLGGTYARNTYKLKHPNSYAQLGVYRDALWAPNHFPHGILPGRVLPELFESGLSRGLDRPFLGSRSVVSEVPLVFGREYIWQTYGEVDKRRRAIGSAIEYKFNSGMYAQGGEFETVGIWSINTPHWQTIDLACQAYNKVSVSLYDTLGVDACEYIIQHAEISLVFVTTQKIATLLTISHKTPTIKTIVSIEKLHDTTRDILIRWGKEKGIEIMDLLEFEALGERNLIVPLPCTPDTITCISYTSGTTSNPKGVVITHGNFVAGAHGLLHGSSYTEDTCVMSYLPLAHCYQRMIDIFTYSFGGKIGYSTGNPLRLLEDAQVLKPNFFPSVPRILNRMYQSGMQSAKLPGPEGALFRKALETKLHNLHTKGEVEHKEYDNLVFSKVKAVLGGQVKLICSASAPISKPCMDFLKIGFACHVIEAYGLTETCGVTTLGWEGDPGSTSKIGPPRMCCEIKLIDVPSMGYTSEDHPNPRGEICTRGPNVFKRYFKDEKKTQEALDDDGWFHTGDIGEVDPAGRFKIIDRLKNIMKLAQGEYVALEKIENIYSACSIVGQLYVHGDALQDHLIAIIVPDPVALSHLVGNHVKVSELNNSKTAKKVMEVLMETAHKAGLKGFEQIKAVHLTTEPFSVENGLLTQTFKVKRREAAEFYKVVIEDIYSRER
ncbi:hypothetical protein FRB96_007549 [Tulasnella sp. 330]|nr:hypothetical protein FRB96_007549 [Tulasnella sp. 330]KAG8882029.1 hypothetical protein FRB97_008803 [Tulasnella sp. 331]